ncbi:MAG: sugar phosphate isomerase/epimerase [Desulfotignum sp.]|nr:sugar phosphate isomerase/epimerase [Desulfotignum sp.]MCF8126048.1 sugar phosphate isomerase/epimerase [Desulfotignum sp.]
MKKLFRLGTTSFIYPDHILPNVRKIGRFFDEIELLIFESMPDTVLPTDKEIAQLADLSKDLDVLYNIHLPTDISLSHGSAAGRQQAADTIARVVDLCMPLAPTTHTLHLEMGQGQDLKNVTAWQGRALDGLDRLIPLLPNLQVISVETLDYPPACLTPLLAAHDLQICLDVGHHFRYGHDLERSFNMFQDRLAVIHLHGVAGSGQTLRDHAGLDQLPPAQLHKVLEVLKRYSGCVNLEVFNRPDLNRSLKVLSEVFDDTLACLPA